MELGKSLVLRHGGRKSKGFPVRKALCNRLDFSVQTISSLPNSALLDHVVPE